MLLFEIFMSFCNKTLLVFLIFSSFSIKITFFNKNIRKNLVFEIPVKIYGLHSLIAQRGRSLEGYDRGIYHYFEFHWFFSNETHILWLIFLFYKDFKGKIVLWGGVYIVKGMVVELTPELFIHYYLFKAIFNDFKGEFYYFIKI